MGTKFYLYRHWDGGRLYVSRTIPTFPRYSYMEFVGTVERSVDGNGKPSLVFSEAAHPQERLLPTRTELERLGVY